MDLGMSQDGNKVTNMQKRALPLPSMTVLSNGVWIPMRKRHGVHTVQKREFTTTKTLVTTTAAPNHHIIMPSSSSSRNSTTVQTTIYRAGSIYSIEKIKKSTTQKSKNNYWFNHYTLTRMNNSLPTTTTTTSSSSQLQEQQKLHVSTEDALLHHTLMYSKSSLVCHYTNQLENEMTCLTEYLDHHENGGDDHRTTRTTISHHTASSSSSSSDVLFNQNVNLLFRYHCILVGVHLLNGNLDKAHYHASELERMLTRDQDENHDHNNKNKNKNKNSSNGREEDVLASNAQNGSWKLSEENKLFSGCLFGWLYGDLERAICIHETLIQKFPRNLFCLFFVYQHAIVLYRLRWLCDMFDQYIAPAFSLDAPSSKNWTRQSMEDNQKNWIDFQFGYYVKGMYCFVLEEMNQMEKAEKTGWDALEHYNDFTKFVSGNKEAVSGVDSDHLEFIQPWAHHSLCHVFHTNGRFTEGIDFMELHRNDWNTCNAFLQTHNNWHLALLYLDRNHAGDLDKCMQLYKQHIWIDQSFDEREDADQSGENSWKDDAGVQCGAVNLLWKMDFCQIANQMNNNSSQKGSLIDHSMDILWDDLSSYCEQLIDKHLSGYIDFHYAYLLARNYLRGLCSKEDIHDFDEALVNQTIPDSNDNLYMKNKRNVTRDMVIPIARGIIYYLSQQFEESYQQMRHLFEQNLDTGFLGNPNYKHNGLGGSQAQREVLGDLWVQVLIESGRNKQAVQELKTRHDYQASTKDDDRYEMASISKNQFQLASRNEHLKQEQVEKINLERAFTFKQPMTASLESTRATSLPKSPREHKHKGPITSQISGESEDTVSSMAANS